VCNDLLYTLLSHYRDTDTRVCFIHIPYCKEQGKEPSMELSDIVRALEIAIKSID
jgi:pyroglutamyl-peptidase